MFRKLWYKFDLWLRGYCIKHLVAKQQECGYDYIEQFCSICKKEQEEESTRLREEDARYVEHMIKTLRGEK